MRGLRGQLMATLGALVALSGMVCATEARAQRDEIAAVNVFISPSGQPFRAPGGAPYPVATWFTQADANGDGKIDHAEFLADAAAFFKVLDRNGDGIVSLGEVAYYEHRICPEIIGQPFIASAQATPRGGARLWLAQFRPDGLDQVPSRSVDSAVPNRLPGTKGLDESKEGASPFSLIDEPEPVATADFNFNGKITKANFLQLADMHFTTLDRDGLGYLTLKRLPKTVAQKMIEHPSRR